MMLQAKETIELRVLVEDPNFNIFGFDYKFIDPDLKGAFEEMFKEHFYFHEIGFETVARFQQRLKAKLNRIAPYYTQLYQTELESKKVNFMLNKDLKETFVRDLTADNTKNHNSNTLGKVVGSNLNSSNFKTNDDSSSNNDYKESNLNNGIAQIGDTNGYLTSQNEENNKSASTSWGNNNSNNQSTQNTENQENGQELEKQKQNESTTLISQGNIGTTSSGQLLEDWRRVLINIFEMYLEECEPLFMAFF
ncbi:hypothetical protein HHOHNEGG_00014 [Clostridium phage LPCPA6]|uniref:Collar protein n=1 Tax=Clostridium phage LPCPA6 TaxID=2924884 RepID=A0AAE9GBT2_9CAUD|nr:adaptor Ad4 [Clostridium phage LPCPA6]UNY47191.1 hypothetical protein HHOHNEGG_00014 [Clostridium phage LPCPA6]